MRARSASAKYAETNTVSPELRPKSSTTAIRSCEPAGVRSEWMSSTLRVTAVEKPMQ
jgi:hypothetical protein